jgi:predicted ester cyclase
VNRDVLIGAMSASLLEGGAYRDLSIKDGVIGEEKQMSAEDNKAVVRRFFEEVVIQGVLETVDEIVASHFVLHDPRYDAPCEGSPNDVKDVVKKIRTAFPDVHVNIKRQIADDNDFVATHWTGTGTHLGEIDSVAPSHVQVEFHGMSFSHLSAGKIDETWNVMEDRLEVAKRLEQLPPNRWCRLICHICPPCCK